MPGPTRVADWLSGRRGLPYETQDYVFFITGRPAEDFLGAAEPAISKPPPPEKPKPSTCLQLAAGLRRGAPERLAVSTVFAPWGVQLSGAFSKAVALAGYGRAQRRYARILGEMRPMVIGTRLRSRGTRDLLPRPRAGGDARRGLAALRQGEGGGRRLHRLEELRLDPGAFSRFSEARNCSSSLFCRIFFTRANFARKCS